MIPDSPIFDQSILARLIEHDAVVQHYRHLFVLLDWRALEPQQASRHMPGPCPHPESTYLKAFLIKVCEEKRYMAKFRSYLVKHLLFVLEGGFHLVLNATQPYGFDVERILPTDRWLN